MARPLQSSQGWQLEDVKKHGNEIFSMEKYAARGVRTTARDPPAVDPSSPTGGRITLTKVEADRKSIITAQVPSG
jgi:hypothetical protein